MASTVELHTGIDGLTDPVINIYANGEDTATVSELEVTEASNRYGVYLFNNDALTGIYSIELLSTDIVRWVGWVAFTTTGINVSSDTYQDALDVYSTGVASESINQSYYGSLENGDVYFSGRLRTDAWDNATDTDQLKALKEASRTIDRLDYRGDKTDPEQLLEFPRGGDTSVPIEIEYATYEVAIKLLEGMDIDKEINETNVKRRRFTTNIETEYFDNGRQSSTYTGLLSSVAWQLLSPYLRDRSAISVIRVS